MSWKKKGLKGAVEAGINSIGSGYDLCDDLRLKHTKAATTSRLISLQDQDHVRSVVFPSSGGGAASISIPNVPKSIKCYPFRANTPSTPRLLIKSSNPLSFHQMSEKFNQELSLSGKIPTGHFNAAFDFSGVWQTDAANTKTLAYDGYSIAVCEIAIAERQFFFHDHVIQAMPLSWDPAALARFIEEYGTHVIVGITIGGTDIIYAKQLYSSPLQTADVQKNLKRIAGKFFGESDALIKFMKDNGLFFMEFPQSPYCKFQMQDIWFMCKRKGGSAIGSLPHNEWCQTVWSQPDVISMSIIPITSLLSGINGSGYLTHAINLYLQCKQLSMTQFSHFTYH
ncbi:hypothetical protein RIF29_06671 [Crotalaria pallida]|uniref:MACPF domain-containing protein n=1 Tax=Crotalaria pallida TaxID=3830 RepID=A0AAN9J634_CROPI